MDHVIEKVAYESWKKFSIRINAQLEFLNYLKLSLYEDLIET